MMREIELTDDELETVADVLGNAKDRAVTDRERARISQAHHEIVDQWSDSRDE